MPSCEEGVSGCRQIKRKYLPGGVDLSGQRQDEAVKEVIYIDARVSLRRGRRVFEERVRPREWAPF